MRFILLCLSVLPVVWSQLTRYNETEARILLNMAAAAYGGQEDINSCIGASQANSHRHTILSQSQEDCDPLNNPCESYIVADDNIQTLYFVFRGTKTTSQLVLEGWSTLQPGIDFFNMGFVNSYFFNGHVLLWPQIESVLTDPQYSSYSVVFTGHSLGGALATLAAARTAEGGFRPNNMIKIVTFGEPRTGSAQFAFNMDSMISYSYRVVYRKDIVPHMPGCEKDKSNPLLTSRDSRPCDPTVLDRAYHRGTEIWYPESMAPGSQYVECVGFPKNEDFSCSDQYKFYITKRNDYIWDHRHYFDVRVPEFGQVGCNPLLPEGEIVLHFEGK